jgi:hypothetical protein
VRANRESNDAEERALGWGSPDARQLGLDAERRRVGFVLYEAEDLL